MFWFFCLIIILFLIFIGKLSSKRRNPIKRIDDDTTSTRFPSATRSYSPPRSRRGYSPQPLKRFYRRDRREMSSQLMNDYLKQHPGASY